MEYSTTSWLGLYVHLVSRRLRKLHRRLLKFNHFVAWVVDRYFTPGYASFTGGSLLCSLNRF